MAKKKIEVEMEDGFSEESKVSELEAQLSLLAGELKSSQENLLREAAEFENIKKRFEREKIEAVKFANFRFAQKLLSVVDALDAALGAPCESEETAKFKDGVEMTKEAFVKVFEEFGVKEIETSGEFDPNLHNAISKADFEGVESGRIGLVYQKGYICNGRVVRPAMVVVAN